jgi:hypothetical protein
MIPTRCRTPLVLALIAALSLPAASHAAWTTNGIPVTTAPGFQHAMGMLHDGKGGVFTFWLDEGSSPPGLKAQLFTSEGIRAPGWPADGLLLVEHVTGVQAAFWIQDALFLLYQTGDPWDIDLEFHVLRTPLDPGAGPWPKVGATVARHFAFAAPDGEGGALLNLADTVSPDSVRVQTSRLDETGATLWSTTRTYQRDVPWIPMASSMIGDGAGGAYLAGSVASGPNQDVWVLRLDATGQPATGWDEDGVALTSAGGMHNHPRLAPSGGGVMVTWTKNQGLGGLWLFAGRIEGSGVPAASPWGFAGVPFADAVSTYAQSASDLGHGVLAAWTELSQVTFSDRVIVQRIRQLGTVQVADGITVAETPYPQLLMSMRPDGEGGGYVSWLEERGGGSGLDVYVQRFDENGPSWPGTGVLVCDAPGDQYGAILSGGAFEDLFVLWSDDRVSVAERDVYLARVTPDGVVPAQMALVSARAEFDRVELTWQGHDGPAEARVERSADGVAWRAVGHVSRDGTDRFVFTDFDVRPGDRWAYRLADPSGEPLTAVEWVNVPAAAGLAVRGFVAGGAPVVLATLAQGPARLEVYDVAGRRIEQVAVMADRAGEHRITLGIDPAPGLYLLRLEQDGVRATARAARLR